MEQREQLSHVERVPATDVCDVGDDCGIGGVSCARRDPRRDVAGLQARQRQVHCAVRARQLGQAVTNGCGHGAGSGAPHAHGEKDPQALQLETEEPEQRQRGVVGPLQVVDHEHTWLAAGAEAVELAELRRQQCAGRLLVGAQDVGVDRPVGEQGLDRRPPRAIGSTDGRLGASVPTNRDPSTDRFGTEPAQQRGFADAGFTTHDQDPAARRQAIEQRPSLGRFVDTPEPIALVHHGGQASDVWGVGMRRRRHPGQRRLVVGEDGRLEPAQLGTGLDSDVLAQQAAGVVDRPQRLHRPTGAVERQGQLRPQPLPVRLAGDLRSQCGRQLDMFTEREADVGQRLDRLHPAAPRIGS